MSSDPINEAVAFAETFDELYEQFDAQVRDLQRLLQTKGDDYSGVHAEHTWMNFVYAAEFSKMPEERIFYARLGEKIGRLHATISNELLFAKKPNYEDQDQVLIDLAGYMVLLVAYHKFIQLQEQT